MKWKKIGTLIAITAMVAGIHACTSEQTEDQPAIQDDQQQIQEQLQQQQQSIEIGEEELRRFAVAIQEVQQIDQKAQQEMDTALEESGLSLKRYQEIGWARQNPDESVDMSEQEDEQYEAVNQAIQQIRNDADKEQEELIEKAGLTLERFREISNAIQQNQDLRTRYLKVQDELE